MTTPQEDHQRREAAFERASARGVIKIAPARVITGPGVPTRDRPAQPRPAAAKARASTSARKPFKSNDARITDADARANALSGRIRAAMPFRASAADVARITREVTAQFDQEFA